MNIFEEVKAAVSVREAVAFYGIKVNRSNMCCCPFHRDRHPSMKVDGKAFGRFYCFGCGETGDVIDFVGKLFGLVPIDAAKKLAEDFHVAYDRLGVERQKTPAEISRENTIQEQRKFAIKKRDLLQVMSAIREEVHNMKMSVEEEALKVFEAHPEHSEAELIIGIINELEDIIYDNRDEDIKARWNEISEGVNYCANRINKIRCGCNKAS